MDVRARAGGLWDSVTGRRWRALAALVVALPAAVTGALIVATWVDVPVGDQWTFVGTVAAAERGSLDLGALWGLHNEHRMPLPKALMLGLASLGDWDVRREMALSWAFAATQAGVLVVLLRRTVAPGAWPVLAALTAALVLSPIQHESWTWGWQLQWYTAMLGVAVALASFLAPGRIGLGRWAAGTGGALAASLSLASGLVLWPILAASSLLRRRSGSPADVPSWAPPATAVVGAVVVAAYLVGYESPPHHAPPVDSLQRPLAVLRYVVLYLGTSLGRSPETAEVWGAVLLAGAAALSFVCLRDDRARGAGLPWVALAWFVVANAAMTALGRVDFGGAQARSSRYTTVSVLLVVSVAALAVIAGARFVSDPSARAGALVAAGSLVFVPVAAGWLEGARQMSATEDVRTVALACLAHERRPDRSCLRGAIGGVDTETVIAGRRVLEGSGARRFTAR